MSIITQPVIRPRLGFTAQEDAVTGGRRVMQIDVNMLVLMHKDVSSHRKQSEMTRELVRG